MTKFTKSQMTNQQHPITPPPELVEQWAHMFEQHTDAEVFNQAAQWGADEELDECCAWLPNLPPWSADNLRAARRPKPPSLKEQALVALKHAEGGWRPVPTDCDIIRRALEALPND